MINDSFNYNLEDIINFENIKNENNNLIFDSPLGTPPTPGFSKDIHSSFDNLTSNNLFNSLILSPFEKNLHDNFQNNNNE